MTEISPPTDLLGAPLPVSVAKPSQLALGLAFPAFAELGLSMQSWPGWLGEATAKADLNLGWDLGSRWASALRFRFNGPNAAKTIARAFDVTERTAKGWLAGGVPYVRHLPDACRILGAWAVLQVLVPGAPPATAEKLQAGIDELAGKLDQLKGELVLIGRRKA